jgi:hypothetical protein
MKHFVLTLLLGACCTLATVAQKGKDEINLSDPFQIDSSDYFLIPKLIDSDEQEVYGKGKGSLPWGDYSDIHFYNARTNETRKLFNGQLALIATFSPRRYYYYDQEKQTETPVNILSNHIVYLVRTENFNGDHALDTEDPLYLYISTKTGEGLRQITPKGFNVLSWTVSKDRKMILVKVQNDKNGNKKFGPGDDQLYFRIDLHDDISKIQCYQISM